MKKHLILSAIFVAALPAAMVVTFLLSPFWRRLEATSGIESMGHSGPADWCFAVVYAVIAVAGTAAWIRFRK